MQYISVCNNHVLRVAVRYRPHFVRSAPLTITFNSCSCEYCCPYGAAVSEIAAERKIGFRRWQFNGGKVQLFRSAGHQNLLKSFALP